MMACAKESIIDAIKVLCPFSLCSLAAEWSLRGPYFPQFFPLSVVPSVWAVVPSVFLPIGCYINASYSPRLLSLRSLFVASFEEFLLSSGCLGCALITLH